MHLVTVAHLGLTLSLSLSRFLLFLPLLGSSQQTITDLLKLGTYVHFFFLLTHSLLTASKAH